MFYFPRREYSKSTIYKQALVGEQLKLGECEGMAKLQDDTGFGWEPASFLPQVLQGGGNASDGPAPLALPSSSTTPFMPAPLCSESEGGSVRKYDFKGYLGNSPKDKLLGHCKMKFLCVFEGNSLVEKIDQG